MDRETTLILPPFNIGHFSDQYSQSILIGKGTCGVVRTLTRKSDHKLFAVKEFKKKRSDNFKQYAECLTREYCIGSVLHHVNVIQTIDMIIDDGKFYEVNF